MYFISTVIITQNDEPYIFNINKRKTLKTTHYSKVHLPVPNYKIHAKLGTKSRKREKLWQYPSEYYSLWLESHGILKIKT